MDQDIKTVIQYPTGATEFDIPFDYLSRKFVRVSLVSDSDRRLLSNITEYRYVSKTKVKILVSTTGFDRVEIRRFTSATERIVDFNDGSVLRATDLNVAQLQSAHIAEEARDATLLTLSLTDSGELDAHNRRIINVAPGVLPSDAATKGQIDEVIGEAGGILQEVQESQKWIKDYIDEFVNDSANLKLVTWVYNNGAAIGGETSITVDIPERVIAVPALYVNGARKDVEWEYEFSPDTKIITLKTPLNKGDFVICMLSESGTPIMNLLNGPTGANEIGFANGRVSDALGCTWISMYGVKLQTVQSIAAGTAVDMTPRIRAAIEAAKNSDTPLQIDLALQTGPSNNKFFYVTEHIDISGLRTIRGPLYLMANPDTMKETFLTSDAVPRPCMLINMNAKYTDGKIHFSTTTGGQQFDEIQTSFVKDPPHDRWIGQLHTTCYTHFRGQLWSRRCAMRFANTYDCTFGAQVAAVDAGSINYYAFQVGNYPWYDKVDESNSLTFPRVLVHSNKYRDILIEGSKTNINACHIEAAVVGPLTGLVQNTYDKQAPGGIATAVFGPTGGQIGVLNYNIHVNSASRGCLLVNTMGCNVSHIFTDDRADVVVGDIFYLGRGGSIGSIYTRSDVKTIGGSGLTIGNIRCGGNLSNTAVRTTIDAAYVGGHLLVNSGKINYAEIGGNATQDQYGSIHGGNCKGSFTMANSSLLENFTINGPYVSTAASPTVIRCTFNGSFKNTGGGHFERCKLKAFPIESKLSPTYYRCTLTGTVTSGVAGARSYFDKCSVGSYDFDNAQDVMVTIDGGSAASMTQQNYSGAILMTGGFRLTGSSVSIPGFKAPTTLSVGYGAMTINPYSGRGYVLLWSGTQAQWRATSLID